ncbi:BnaAnng17730D [Brassica napus]|uniref:BnaAnng17730D protein n=1 Tax=Brassica napus TaxID=3708 RepID=A0A078JBH1_BRANA|nr:BnaAnng17730D [Brassica napus]
MVSLGHGRTRTMWLLHYYKLSSMTILNL